jgi:hypothetical protein
MTLHTQDKLQCVYTCCSHDICLCSSLSHKYLGSVVPVLRSCREDHVEKVCSGPGSCDDAHQAQGPVDAHEQGVLVLEAQQVHRVSRRQGLESES